MLCKTEWTETCDGVASGDNPEWAPVREWRGPDHRPLGAEEAEAVRRRSPRRPLRELVVAV